MVAKYFGIALSQLLEHSYHVMHIRLPDKLNVVNHFYLQAFFSEQSFPSFPTSVSAGNDTFMTENITQDYINCIP